MNRMWTGGGGGGASRKRKDGDTFYKASVIPTSSNRLLAGYMAHEFLTKGTLFGHKFDSTRDEEALAEAKKPNKESYAEVASLLKTDGAHIPEIVNPTQLVRWIQM